MPVDFSQLAALRAGIKAAESRVVPAAAAITGTAAHAIERTAQGNAPVLSGELRGSIHAVQVGASSWEVRADSGHAEYVENGTSVMAPEPYMGPAFDAGVPGLERGLADVAAEIL